MEEDSGLHTHAARRMESLPHPERNAGPEIFGGQSGRQLRGLHAPLGEPGGIAREHSHGTFRARRKPCIISLIFHGVPTSLPLSLRYAKRTLTSVNAAASSLRARVGPRIPRGAHFLQVRQGRGGGLKPP